MKTYQHKQSGTVIIVAMVSMAAALTPLGFHFGWQFFLSLPLLMLSAWLFHSLTIEITEDELRWYFGPGLISKRVALKDIASARVERTCFLEGWGIHWSRFGWLYNVDGFGAVAVVLQNGRRFALGTDEPEALSAALRENTGIIKPFNGG